MQKCWKLEVNTISLEGIRITISTLLFIAYFKSSVCHWVKKVKGLRSANWQL